MKGFIALVTIALSLSTTPTVAAEDPFKAIGKRAKDRCAERSVDVHSAAILRDEGKSREEILAALKRPDDQWSIDERYVDVLFQFAKTDPEHFKRFALKSCRVYFWNLFQKELCDSVFDPKESALCNRAVDQSAKRIITSAYDELTL